MPKAHKIYRPLADRNFDFETPVVSIGPSGDGIETQYLEAQRRRNIQRLLLQIANMARDEGYPRAATLIFETEQEVNRLFFINIASKR